MEGRRFDADHPAVRAQAERALRHALEDAYEWALFAFHDAADDGTWRGDRAAVMDFIGWLADLAAEAEREGGEGVTPPPHNE